MLASWLLLACAGVAVAAPQLVSVDVNSNGAATRSHGSQVAVGVPGLVSVDVNGGGMGTRSHGSQVAVGIPGLVSVDVNGGGMGTRSHGSQVAVGIPGLVSVDVSKDGVGINRPQATQVAVGVPQPVSVDVRKNVVGNRPLATQEVVVAPPRSTVVKTHTVDTRQDFVNSGSVTTLDSSGAQLVQSTGDALTQLLQLIFRIPSIVQVQTRKLVQQPLQGAHDHQDHGFVKTQVVVG